MQKYSEGTRLRVMIEVEVTYSGSMNIEADYTDDDGSTFSIAVPYSDVVPDDTDDGVETFKDARGLVFEGTAEEFRGDDVANKALEYARQLTIDDDKTRTVLIVPGQSIDHALSFVNVGVRQVRHSELREEESRLFGV